MSSDVNTPEEGARPQAEQAESFQFQTEINQLLHLLIHSLYTKREIFLRELVSNAADALNKVQFEQLTRHDITAPDAELAIDIDSDEEARTLTLRDTGVGMTRAELIQNLGTIAHSGSRAFLKRLADQKGEGADQKGEGGAPNLDLIGQFGVGFYSVFMVADKVSVTSRSMLPEETAHTWISQGEGSFTIEPAEMEGRGTQITIHMKDDASEFMSKWRLEEIIKTYSNFVPFPIRVQGQEANRRKAIWTMSRSEVTSEMYDEFYGHLAHSTKKPLAHLHIQADVPIQFNAIVYIPHEAPLWYSPNEQGHGLQLYVKRVFIQENCEELVPRYLRFLKGVVDVDDLPLNVSREVIQKSPLLAKIESNLTRKTLQLLTDMAEKEPEKYEAFWRDFGMFLKEGSREDHKNKDALAELIRFNSSHHVDSKGQTSLARYVERMPAGQEEIYYFTGTNRDAIERSPHLELMKRKHYEVLYLTEPIDPLVIMSLGTYKEKKLRIIDDPSLKLEDEKKPEPEQPVTDLMDFMKQVLGERVEDVRVSSRLVESPSCLVNPEHSMSSDMQRLYGMMDKDFKFSRKVLEINPHHPMIQNLSRAYERVMGDPSAQEKLRPYVHHMLDAALLAEGLHPNPADLVTGLNQLLTIATGTLAPAAGPKEGSPQSGAPSGSQSVAPSESSPSSEVQS